MKKKIDKSINELKDYSKKIYLKDKRISIYTVFKIFKSKLIEDEIFERSLAVAYSFTLATFPLIIFLFTLIPYINTWVPEIDSIKILAFLEGAMPSNMYEIAEATIADLVETKRSGLLSLGVISSLFLSTNGFNTLIKTFNSCHRIEENRGFIKTRIIALTLTIVFMLVLIISILLSTVGEIFINFISENNVFEGVEAYYSLIISRLSILFITFYLGITSIFYFAPVKHNKWTFFSSGSIMSALGCVCISLIFSYYINTFATYNKFYGSIGILIAYMGWMYIISSILLIGFEWNTSIDIAINSNINTSIPFKTYE